MAAQKTALIAGATGLIGKECLRLLLADKYYTNVVVLSRKAIHFSHPKMQEQIIDFDQLDNYKHVIKADHVFCCLGTTMKKAGSKIKFRKVDLEYPYQIGKIALENGAVQYNLVSALGADLKSKIFYNKTKGEVEQLLSQLNYPSLNIYRPSILLGDRKENRPEEKTGIMVMSALEFLLIGPLVKYRPIQAYSVAAAMVRNAKREVPGVNIYESDKIKDMA